VIRAALLLALAPSAAPPAAAPGTRPGTHAGQEKDGLRPNDPSLCTVCAGDPARMAAAGIVSHGGFGFGREDTAAVDAWLATSDIKWIETEHFELGFALGPYKVRLEEKDRLGAEIERLQAANPDLRPKTKVLDPWLRAHIYALRLEALWDRFLELVQVDASAFPDGTRVWDMRTKYMGEGPYLGMKNKYEVLILESEAGHISYLEHEFGLHHGSTQRWHLPDDGTLSVTIHKQQGQLRIDTALHGHVAFNLAHNFLDGFKHYSYDTPVWLHEGFAHWMEREIDPAYNTFDSSEGATAVESRKERWRAEVLKLLASGEAPRLTQLVALRTYAELELDDHYVTWSMVDFLLQAHPDAFARLVNGLKGLKNEQGLPDGGRVQDAQRELFKELFGGYARFDEDWKAWVLATYR
jgi:hypothetical protein